MRLLPLVLLTLAACTSPRSDADGLALPADTTERGAVLHLIADADTVAFRSAFDALRATPYTRYERFAHHTDGALTGTQTRIIQVENGAATVIEQAAAGVFEKESPLRQALAPTEALDAANLASFVLPADPAYLQARHYHAYTYRVLPDTLLGTTRARVVEIAVRPGTDDPPAVRRARYYLDAATSRVLAVYLERIDHGLWFAESSRYYLRIRLHGDAYVPDMGRFVTQTDLPFRAPRRVERLVAYYDLGN